MTCWLASYPKSGNTWLRAVYAAATTGADVDVNRLPAGGVPANRELVDTALGLATADLTPAEMEVIRPRADEVVADAAGPTGWAVRKVHDAFTVGPTGEPVVSVAASRAAVYVLRDPRDVAVSLAAHSGRPVAEVVAKLADPAAAHGLVREGLGLHGRQRIGTWSDHVRSWLEQTRMPVHLLRYEDALADPVGVFGPALRFIGCEVTDEQVAVAVDRASFRNLAEQEAAAGFGERPLPGGRFFRRGQAGAWRDELPAELAEAVVRTHGDVMRRYGYSDFE
jgi:aryl sulfotransferase